MLKASYIITLLSGIGLFNSCTGNFINKQEYPQEIVYLQRQETAYGNYLAGRVAHIRQDYDNAANYYVKTIEKGFVNKDLLGKTYIILASQGKIDEAAKYANIARENGDKNNFIDIINAVKAFKHKNYKLYQLLLAYSFMNIVPSTVNVGIHMFTVYMYNSVPRNRRYAIIWGKANRVHFESQKSIIVYFTILRTSIPINYQ